MSNPHRTASTRSIATTSDRELLDQLDQLVANAVRGDRHAIGAIAIAFGPMLLQEVRKELGPLFENEGGDVLQDFFLAMTEAQLTFPSIRGAGVPWMKRTARTFARQHLLERGRAGGEAG